MWKIRLSHIILIYAYIAYVSAIQTAVTNLDFDGNQFVRVDIESSASIPGENRNHTSYYFSNFRATWEDARHICTNVMERQFVVVDTKEKNLEVQAALEAWGGEPYYVWFWTSGIFSQQPDSFAAMIWNTTGEIIQYNNFFEGISLHFSRDSAIVIHRADRNWGITYPEYTFNFICE